MFLDYSYGKSFEMFKVWLREIVFSPMGKEALFQLWLRMKAKKVIFALNSARMGQNLTLVFAGFTRRCHRPGNRN
jgi:hypothetical protein|tara:strand:+ start:59 stop:283 length:225 start_codon:yes stop_codon:yes gene_type:complete